MATASKTDAPKKKRVSHVPANETKGDKFKRVAGLRMGKALDAISRLGSVSGSGYEYTEEQVSRMETALREALNASIARFKGSKKTGTGFQF